MVPTFPSYWKPACRFFLMHITEHMQHAGSSGGPHEGGEIKPTTELILSFMLLTPALSSTVECSCENWFGLREGRDWYFCHYIQRVAEKESKRLGGEGDVASAGSETWFIHMCKTAGAPPHTLSLQSPCRSTVTPLPPTAAVNAKTMIPLHFHSHLHPASPCQ